MPSVIPADGGFMVDGTFVDSRGLKPEQIQALSAQATTDYAQPQGGADWSNPAPDGGYVQEPSAAEANAAFAKAMGAKAQAASPGLGPTKEALAYLATQKPGPNDAYLRGMGQMSAENALPGGAPVAQGAAAAAPAQPAEEPGITLASKMAGAPAPVVAPGQTATPEGMAARMAMGATVPAGGARPSGLLGADTRGLDRAYREQAEAIQEGAKVGAARAAEQTTYAQTAADAAEKMAQDQAIKQADRQRALQGQMDKLQKAQDDFNKISTTIDPSRWYASRDTGQKILAGLGIFLGAFGHNGNQALGIITKAVDDDLRAQETQLQANLQKGKENVGFTQNLLGQMRQNFGDDIAAEAAARSTMLENTKMRLAAMAAKYDAPEMQAKAQQALGVLDEQAQKSKFDFRQRMAELGIKKEQADAEMEKANMARVSAALEGKTAGNDRFVPGLNRYAIDPKAAEKLRDAHANYKDLDGLLAQAIDLRKKYGSEDFGPAKTEMQTIGAQIEAQLAKDDSIRLSDTGQRIVKQMTGGDINSWGYIQPALERLRKNVNQSFMNKAESYLDPNQPGGGGAGYTFRTPGNG